MNTFTFDELTKEAQERAEGLYYYDEAILGFIRSASDFSPKQPPTIAEAMNALGWTFDEKGNRTNKPPIYEAYKKTSSFKHPTLSLAELRELYTEAIAQKNPWRACALAEIIYDIENPTEARERYEVFDSVREAVAQEYDDVMAA